MRDASTSALDSTKETSTIKSTSDNKPNVVDAETTRLKEMYERLNNRSSAMPTGDGHYLKMQPSKHKRLFFDHTKTVECDITYPSEPNKKVHRIKFYVREILNGKKSDVEEEWTTSVRTSTQIIKWLLKGYYEIDVTRHGSTKNDTRYDIDPVL